MEGISKGALDGNLNEKERATVIKRIADFIKKEGSGLGHRRYKCSCCDRSSNCICSRYVFSYLLCTGLNLLNVVVSIFLLDKFIGESSHNRPDFVTFLVILVLISGTSEHKHNFLSLGPLWIDSLGDDTDLKRNEAKSVLTTLFPRYIHLEYQVRFQMFEFQVF